MKKQGNTSDFIYDRNLDLHRSFMEVLRTSAGIPLRDMFAEAALRPSVRFWVSEGRASIVIGAMMRGATLENMNAKRKEMFEEIYRRVKMKMEADPDLCMTHAVTETIYEEAPEFYLTPESARSIIYRLRAARKRNAILASKLKKLTIT